MVLRLNAETSDPAWSGVRTRIIVRRMAPQWAELSKAGRQRSKPIARQNDRASAVQPAWTEGWWRSQTPLLLYAALNRSQRAGLLRAIQSLRRMGRRADSSRLCEITDQEITEELSEHQGMGLKSG